MTAARGDCQVCGADYALVPSTGMVRRHQVQPKGQPPTVGKRPCPGSGRPRVTPPPAPAPPEPTRPLPPEVQACAHEWSGWTRLPRTREDFRRCEHCCHIELQARQPCVLCGDEDARAFEVPEYGTAYVCGPCIEGLAP